MEQIWTWVQNTAVDMVTGPTTQITGVKISTLAIVVIGLIVAMGVGNAQSKNPFVWHVLGRWFYYQRNQYLFCAAIAGCIWTQVHFSELDLLSVKMLSFGVVAAVCGRLCIPEQADEMPNSLYYGYWPMTLLVGAVLWVGVSALGLPVWVLYLFVFMLSFRGGMKYAENFVVQDGHITPLGVIFEAVTARRRH